MADEPDVLDQWQAFHEARKSGVFATDAAKILGLSKYGSALSVWNDKLGLSEPGKSSLPAWLGLKLQSTVAELYTSKTGQKLRAANLDYRHPEYAWLGTHLDYRAWGAPRLLVEAKTRSYQTGWGPDGSQKVPPDVWAQVQHELLVMGADECHVAVLFGLGHDFRVYPIPRNEKFIEQWAQRASIFWHENVLAQIPPEPTGYAGDSAAIQARFPQETEPLRAATPEQEMLVNRLRVARQATVDAEFAQTEIENQIKAIIGEGTGLTGSFGKITWKRSRDGVSVDWEQVAVTRENVIEDLFAIVNPGDDPETVARLARAQAVASTAVSLAETVKPGSRRFLVDFKEE